MPSRHPRISARIRPDTLIALAGSIAVCVLLVLLVATIVVSPMNGEDYGLSLPLSHVSLWLQLPQLGQFIWLHAVGWNARLGEVLAIIELALPHVVYAGIQSVCAAAFVIVVALLACDRQVERKPFGYACLMALAMVYLTWPRLGIFFWTTAAAGYLQPLTASMFLIWLLINPQRRKRVQESPLHVIGVGVLAFAVGFSFENVGPALLIYLLAVAVIAYKQRQSGWKLALSAAIIMGLGWISLMMVPSTYHRVMFYRNALHVPPLSLNWMMHRIESVTGVFVSVSWPLAILAGIGLFGLLRKKDCNRSHADLLLLLLPAGLIVGATVLAPYTEPRAFVLPWAIMLCITLRGLMCLCSTSLRIGVLAVACSALSIPVAVHTYRAYASFATQVDARTNKILALTGTPACRQGIHIRAIHTDASTRVLNNRDDWVMHALHQVGRFYRCKLLPDSVPDAQ